MLASITPLGERGRGGSWGVTVAAFAIGATAAGSALGVVLGALGGATLGGLSAHTRLALLAASLAAALALDLRPGGPPSPRRQVNERWLDEFRGWVYGLGFGAQLGLGLGTVVTSAATYVSCVAALLTADPAAGALVLGCFGALRGLTPLAAAHVRAPRQLMRLHARLDRWRVPATRLRLAVLTATLLTAAIAASA